MDIRLMELRLVNFKGIRDFAFETEGKSTSVYGDNAVGKTSLIDAFMWLLFDKDSTDRKDFNIKTLNESGDVIHGLEHEVMAVLLIDNKPLALRKVYSEKWTKKRGEADKQLTGHTTDYFVNDVPVKKGDYTNRIAEITDEDTFKLLTNVLYFNENLHWSKRRDILIEVCGDVSDEEVIAHDEVLVSLSGVLSDYSVDEYRAIIKASLKKLNDEIKKLPIRIDEVNKSLPAIGSIDFVQAKANKEKLEEQSETLQAQINQLKVDDGKSEKKRKISELNSQLFVIKTRMEQTHQREMMQAKNELSEKTFEIQKKVMLIENFEGKIKRTQQDIADIQTSMDNLKKEFFMIQKSQPAELGTDSVCPTCKQDIPAYQIEETHQKHITSFNTSKAKSLMDINKKGKELKDEKELLENFLKDYHQKLEQAQSEKLVIQKEASKINDQIASIQAVQAEMKMPAEYAEIVKDIETLEAELENNQDNSQERIQELQMLIDTNKQGISEITETLAKEQQIKQADERIIELMAEEKSFSKEYAKLEKQDFLCEEFIKSKVALMEDKINSKFELARFKMFETLINGGIAETCITTYDGVPYPDLNNGMKVNIALDIIRTLSKHYNTHIPIFVDNAESISKLLDTDSQMIRLIVSEKDKQLRVEVEN